MDKNAPPSRLARFFRSGTMRAVIGFAIFMAIYSAIQLGHLLWKYGSDFAANAPEGEIFDLLPAVIAALLLPPLYVLLYRRLEKRPVHEFALNTMLPHLALGLLIGLTLQTLSILTVALLGTATLTAVNPLSFMRPALAMALGAAVFEEIVFRGIVFRILQEKTGSYAALLISGLLFGAMHLGNPNATLSSALMIAIEAGILLGAAYIYSGTLWLPIGLHFGWNFTQSGIFSANTSGMELPPGLLQISLEGPDWLTGGAFGPEAAIQTVLFCLVAAALMLAAARRKGAIVLFRGKRPA